MPAHAVKPCTYQGCNTLVRDGTGRCEKHPRKAWSRPRPERGSGSRNQKERRLLFARNPLCVECERHGFVTLATIRDHIIPLAEGGADTDDNTQGLCKACHDEKTAAEARRGIQRS